MADIATSTRQDRPHESPFAENTTVFFSEEQVEHTKHRRKGGEDVAVFF